MVDSLIFLDYRMKKALPSIDAPRISLTLPVSGKKIKFRPFVNREKKILLLSKAAEDWDSTVETLSDVISSCTFGEVELAKTPLTDIAFLFVKMRINAMGNIIPITTQCKACEYEIQLNYNLEEAAVTTDWIDDLDLSGVHISFRAPTLEDTKLIGKDDEAFVASLITGVYTQDEVYDLSEYSLTDLVNWLNELPDEEVKKLNAHMKKLPTLRQEVKYSCPKCSHEHKVTLEGLADFF